MHCNRIFLLFLILALLLAGCAPKVSADARVQDTAGFLSETSFLGDSITAHMASRSPISKKQLWCAKTRYLNLDSRITYAKIVAPDTGAEETIAAVAARLRPRYLVITLGIDYGVYYYRDEQQSFSRCYEKLLDAILTASPDTVVLVQSVFPVTAASKAITNEMIDRANGTLRALCTRMGIDYLDTQSVLRDSEGYLKSDFCSDTDGIHLNEAGYTAMLDYIARYGEERGW